MNVAYEGYVLDCLLPLWLDSSGDLLLEVAPLTHQNSKETNDILILIMFVKFLTGYVFLST